MDIFEQQRLWVHVIIPLLTLGVVLPLLIAGLLVARRRKMLRLWHLESAAILMLAFLMYLYLRGGPPGSPQRVARNFLSAIEAFDCDTAWQYFSSQSQRAIQIASDKKKIDPLLSHVQRRYLEPKNLYCLPTVAPFFHGYRASSVKLLKIQGTTATVAVKKGIPTGFLIPGFWPTRTRYEDHELMLVREGSKWKIAFQP
jgi:hypothetical protein